ncbi:MAG: ATP-dependent zinc metalloprotease FtsH [Anaerovoracaceae bacterium]
MKSKWYRTLLVYAIIFVGVITMAYMYTSTQAEQEVQEVEFSEFVTELQKGNVKELTLIDTSMEGTLKNGDKIHAYAPSSIQLMSVNSEFIMPQVEEGTLVVTSEEPRVTPWYVSMLPYLLTIVIFVVIWVFFMNSAQGGGKAMSFGRSKAKLYKDDGKKVTFDDVAGLKEEKEELQEIVDFLKKPKKYTALGARIPKGVLLVGPPGTGKTYVTKAVSGEAGVPFYSISGSDFVEMFVGVGASRVRDLFEQAKKNAPSIIFIDEIDAVGRRRGAGLGGGHDEREQTLNQMLVEMDGFGLNEGVIVFAATNRPDVLDPALLRPGRFDRQIVIGLPDVAGREEIFRVHSANKPLDETVRPDVLARMTPGFSPADIENVLNEAALLTARREGKSITMEEIEEAITKVMAGPAKKSRTVTETERRLTAYHEAGHAVLIRNLPDSDPVHQVTIVPRGMAGGMTMFLPKEDRSFESKKRMESSLVHLLGGRVAEALVLDDISTGASNDIERATSIARSMVAKYGMSERLGTVNYSDSDEVFLGKDFTSKKNFSEATAALIDEEVKKLIDHAYARAEELLKENMDKLQLVAETLLEIETLNAEQFEQLYTGEKTKEEIISETRSAEAEKEERIARQRAIAEQEEAEAIKKLEDEVKKQDEFLKRLENLRPEEIVFENRREGNAAEKPEERGNADGSENNNNNNN